MTTDADKLQDMKIEKLEEQVAEIKLVTHGSKLLQWSGIITEHKKLESTMSKIAESSSFTARLVGGLTALAAIAGAIIGILKVM